MDENPFEAPQTAELIPEPRAHDRAFLRKVAIDQKVILFCVLAQILIVAASTTAQRFRGPVDENAASGSTELRFALFGAALLVAMLAVLLTGVVFVYRLAARLINPAFGVLYAIIAFAPCLGIFILFFVTNRATVLLKKEGVRVGFMGAKLTDIR